MRLHVLGIPHTQTHRDFVGCAFTQKVLKFVEMMRGRGHEIIHYGHERTDIQPGADVELVTVIRDQDHRDSYGSDYVDQQSWRHLGFAHYYRTDDLAHQRFHANAIKEIARRKQPRDFLLCFWGWGHRAIADAHPDMIAVEPGIGYGAAWARWRVYESHAIRMAIGGIGAVNTCTQDNYHVVIPNYFDPRDFVYQETKEDYILYLGRIYTGKGVDVAIEVAEHTGCPLIVAGQGSLTDMGYRDLPPNIREVGYADLAQRQQLMAGARALFIASRYGEPFAGVQVEAWLSGTPVISPDYAAFAEYNRHGQTGIRCRTFRDYVRAVDQVGQLSSQACREHGLRFALSEIAPEYERYFQDVLAVYTGRGWYQL